MRLVLQVCLNGSRRLGEHPALPVTASELAAAARAAVDAGAVDIHVHPKRPDGTDTLDPDVVGGVLEAVRAAVPGIPVGVTTGAWTEPDANRRADLVGAWQIHPDHASVNWHEDGAELVAGALLTLGIGIEAGAWSGTVGAERFLASSLKSQVLRVLAEVIDLDAARAPATARALLAALGDPPPAAVLLHGEGPSTWPVLRLAAELGLDMRIGLEDVLLGPDGQDAADNAALVRTALDATQRSGDPPA